MFKKVLLSFLASLILFFSVAPYFGAAHAEGNPPPPTPVPTTTPTMSGTWYNQSFGDWFMKVYDQNNPSEIFGERYTAAQVEWVIYGIWSFMINFVMGPKAGAVVACAFGAYAGAVGGATGTVTGGAVQNNQGSSCLGQAITNLLGDNFPKATKQSLASAVLADRPFSGISYIRNQVKNFSLVPTAHAQTVGFGFSALSSIQAIWVAVRNIAYGLFVIAAVVFAFMIMFRVKINPQTVITIQSAIPKMIVALVLVTFSYAIAGFLVDAMYIVIGIISFIMAPLIPHVDLFQTQTYKAADIFNMLTVGPITTTTGTTTASAGGIVGLLGLYLGPLMVLLLIGMLIIAAIGIGAAATGAGVVLDIPVAIVLILILIVFIILLWMSIKVIWALFKAFANVILLTVFAPFQLSLGILIPNFGFGQWIKSYISNLAVFVVTGVMALFAWFFSLTAWGFMGFGSKGANLTLQFTGGTANPWPPLLGSMASGDVGTALALAGVAFVFFTMTPKAAELVQSFLSGKPFAYGSAIGEAVMPVGAFTQYQANQVAREGRLPSWISNILRLNDKQQEALQSVAKTYLSMTGKH